MGFRVYHFYGVEVQGFAFKLLTTLQSNVGT